MNFKTVAADKPISYNELCTLLGDPYDSMIKFAVDIETKIVVFGGEMHADAEKVLLENGSLQKNIWGANIYPRRERNAWLEYTSLINIRPSQNNLSLEITSIEIRNKILAIVNNVIT